MATLLRTVDDEIGEARATLAALEAESALTAPALKALRADTARLAALEASKDSPGLAGQLAAERSTSGLAWPKVRPEFSRLEHRERELERELERQAAWVRQLEDRRIPEIDDPIAMARTALAALEDRSARNVEAIAERRAERTRLDVNSRLGDAGARRNLADVETSLADLETTRTHLLADVERQRGALQGLLDRRGQYERDREAARIAVLGARWSELQLALEAAAAQLLEAYQGLGAIHEAWPGVLGQTSWGWLPDPGELERIRDGVRRLALRRPG